MRESPADQEKRGVVASIPGPSNANLQYLCVGIRRRGTAERIDEGPETIPARRVAASGSLPVVATPTNGSAHGSEQDDRQTDQHQDCADRHQDGNAQDETDNQDYDTSCDHGLGFPTVIPIET